MTGHFEALLVGCPRCFHQLIAGQGFFSPLQPLLQTCLGIFLEVTKDGGKIVIEFGYEKRIPLFWNVSLLIDYKGSTAGS